MVNTNYRIEALEYLLDKECLPEKYDPLVPFKKEMISQFHRMGYQTKNEIANLSDAELLNAGLRDEEIIRLLRRFLRIYDPKPQKFRELQMLNPESKMKLSFQELYYLPGVKETLIKVDFGEKIPYIPAFFRRNPDLFSVSLSKHEPHFIFMRGMIH